MCGVGALLDTCSPLVSDPIRSIDGGDPPGGCPGDHPRDHPLVKCVTVLEVRGNDATGTAKTLHAHPHQGCFQPSPSP